MSIRLRHGRQLLETTNYPINTIALRIGFNSDTYFISKFKDQFRQTPQQYRLDERLQNDSNYL